MNSDAVPGYHATCTVQASDEGTSANWHKVSGNPVLGGDLGTCFDVTLIQEDGKYRMWYSGGEQYEPNAIGYATSSDGIRWRQCSSNPIFAADRRLLWYNGRKGNVEQIGLVTHTGYDLGFPAP